MWTRKVSTKDSRVNEGTIAERILSAMDYIQDGDEILQIVIRTLGTVDRTWHYRIYDRGTQNLLPVVLKAAGERCPIRIIRSAKEQASHVAELKKVLYHDPSLIEQEKSLKELREITKLDHTIDCEAPSCACGKQEATDTVYGIERRKEIARQIKSGATIVHAEPLKI